MSAGDLAAVVVTVCVVVIMTVLLYVLFQLLEVLRSLRSATEQLVAEGLPAMSELRSTVDSADVELERLHEVLDSAAVVSGGVIGAGRAVARFVRWPWIKARALMAGLVRARRSLGGD